MNKILLQSLCLALLLAGCSTKPTTTDSAVTTAPPSRYAPAPSADPDARKMESAPDPGAANADIDELAAGPSTAPTYLASRSVASRRVDAEPEALAMQPQAQRFNAATPATAAPAYGGNGMIREVAPPPTWQAPPESGEGYTSYADNTEQTTVQNPVSTFGLDVDTGSYSNVRRFLNQGQLPPPDAVRAEELLNYFSYDYPAPERGSPFAVRTELGAAPWNPQHLLLRVGIKAVGQTTVSMPPANLVFLVDVSGSMDEPDKLPLVRNALKLLTSKLRPQDHVSIVVYAGDTEVVLAPTGGDNKATIYTAIDRLQASGSTNGEAGIQLAYEQARAGFIAGGINRILLATDGDFNVGMTNIDQLKALIARERRSGVSLTTLGVGQGNYQEPVMQQLADVGNGNYAYLETLDEARKVLLEQLTATLDTVAADVKLQMEFNPRQIAAWRLIGYEKRALREQDFTNDRVDAGEVGAGKSVVALYELTPASDRHSRRYGNDEESNGSGLDAELGYLKIRYKTPDHRQVFQMQHAIHREGYGMPGPDWRFAAAVAGFAQLLRGNDAMGSFGWQDVKDLAQQGLGRDIGGYRQDFVRMVDLAAAIAPAQISANDPPTWQGE